MEKKKYPCRTEAISGITYRIGIFRDGTLRSSTSFDDRAGADRYVEFFAGKFPEYKLEITEKPWTNNLCIECGREEY